MRVAVFSTKPYDRRFFERANAEFEHELVFFEAHLNTHTAELARGFEAVCAFVNDQLSEEVLATLNEGGTRLIALRSAGFNHVDLQAAQRLNMTVARVPAYSPHAVAEHAVALILCLNRRIHRAYNRTREANFALEGLGGFDLHGRTVGVVGTGKIGEAFARIMSGFGCRVLAYDVAESEACRDLGVQYVSLEKLFSESEIISLHCPLTPQTHHIINTESIAQMRPGVMIINTGRGALIDTPAVISGLKTRRIGYLGLDVYEEEEQLFFEDLSSEIIDDDVFMRLLTFPNVLVTAHQAFFTDEAMHNIAQTTLSNISAFETQAGTLHAIAWTS